MDLFSCYFVTCFDSNQLHIFFHILTFRSSSNDKCACSIYAGWPRRFWNAPSWTCCLLTNGSTLVFRLILETFCYFLLSRFVIFSLVEFYICIWFLGYWHISNYTVLWWHSCRCLICLLIENECIPSLSYFRVCGGVVNLTRWPICSGVVQLASICRHTGGLRSCKNDLSIQWVKIKRCAFVSSKCGVISIRDHDVLYVAESVAIVSFNFKRLFESNCCYIIKKKVSLQTKHFHFFIYTIIIQDVSVNLTLMFGHIVRLDL